MPADQGDLDETRLRSYDFAQFPQFKRGYLMRHLRFWHIIPAVTVAFAAGAGFALSQEAGKTQYRDGLHGVDFTGLDAAGKERALDLMNANGCDCGCGMTIAQCRVDDKTCPRSPGLASSVIAAVKAGKSDDQVVASLKGGDGDAAVKAEAAPTVQINVEGSPFKGPEDAKVTIVTFEDFQCPYCRRASPVVEEVRMKHPQDVKLVFKHFPLVSIHPQAKPAAIAAHAAHLQGKFWEMHKVLYENQGALGNEQLRGYAESIGLDMQAYDEAVADPETARIVDAEIRDGSTLGVRGTPSVYVNGVKAPSWSGDVLDMMVAAGKNGEDVGMVAGKITAQRQAQAAANRPQRPDPNTVYEIDTAGAAFDGPADAPVEVVSFSDYQCPYCAATEPLLEQIKEAYPTQARVVYKNFPLSFHKAARPAAEAALFAKEHGKFLEMHELLFKNSRQLTMENFKSFATQIGLDPAALEESVKAETYKTVIDKDMNDGQKAAVSGTPTLFVNGKRVVQRDFNSIKQMIDEVIAKGNASGS